MPRCPGVYIMTGQSARVLYVGQSGNLRVRLASYKNARPDRAPRKVIRLIHQVDSIVWEKCGSRNAARLRESELLQLYRPRFNRLGVYPKAYGYIWARCATDSIELGRAQSPAVQAEVFGAFKGAVVAYGALVRLLWAALRQPVSPADFPTGLLDTRVRSPWSLTGRLPDPRFDGPALARMLRDLLAGASPGLLQVLPALLPAPGPGNQFMNSLYLRDLESLRQFYHCGPERNALAKARYDLPGSVIAQADLDQILLSLGPRKSALETGSGVLKTGA